MFLFLFLFFLMLWLCSFFRLKEFFQVKNGLTTSLYIYIYIYIYLAHTVPPSLTSHRLFLSGAFVNSGELFNQLLSKKCLKFALVFVKELL